MPRRRNPRLEKQRAAQEALRERNASAGIPETCHLDHAISAALYVYARQCAQQQIMDPTLGKLLTLASDILIDAKNDDGLPKWDADIVLEKIRYRASHRKPADRQRLLKAILTKQDRIPDPEVHDAW